MKKKAKKKIFYQNNDDKNDDIQEKMKEAIITYKKMLEIQKTLKQTYQDLTHK